MKTILVTTDQEISVKDITPEKDFYKHASDLLGGGIVEKVNIWPIFTNIGFKPIMLIDESGSLKGLPKNRLGTILYNALAPDTYFINIHGDVLFGKLDYGPSGPDWFPLTDQETAKLMEGLKHVL